jgi:Fe2+ or Zn2+ uptake regulation protein
LSRKSINPLLTNYANNDNVSQMVKKIPLQDIEQLFHTHGVAYTAQRHTVWQYFAEQVQGHTIGEAVDALRQTHIGQATVYRTVFLLLDLGLLCRIQDDLTGKTYFVAVRPGHSHPLICRTCHNIVDFDACDLSVLEKLLARETGYLIERHHLEVYGICPVCQEHATEAPC